MPYVTVSVPVNEVIDDVLEHASVADLRSALETSSARDSGDPRAAVSDAIAQIRRGDMLDAITTLEREFWPKWASASDSEAAFRAAVNDNREAATCKAG